MARFKLSVSSMKEPWKSIKAIELVQVRLFDMNNGPKIVGIFQRETDLSRQPLQATIFQSPLVPNDWLICFWRADSPNHRSKSPGALRCAEALRSIGLVDHTMWWQTTNGEFRQNQSQDLVGKAFKCFGQDSATPKLTGAGKCAGASVPLKEKHCAKLN